MERVARLPVSPARNLFAILAQEPQGCVVSLPLPPPRPRPRPRAPPSIFRLPVRRHENAGHVDSTSYASRRLIELPASLRGKEEDAWQIKEIIDEFSAPCFKGG